MKKRIICLVVFLFSYLSVYSIPTPRHSFDVLNYKLFFDIYNCFKTPFPKTFIANNIIYFRVDSTLNSIKLNAVNTSLTIDSVRLLNGTVLNYTHSANILNITLDRAYNPNEFVTIKIYYRHNSVVDNAFYVSNGMVFTDSPPEGARKWFPCWDKPSDKATVDITAKVPLTARLGSNGRLADSTVTGDTIYYHWISRDPVATYLTVFTGKVGYRQDVLYWHKLFNPNDSIPTVFYSNSGEDFSAIKNLMNSAMTFFSQKFGEYPFEKNGFATIQGGAGFTWGGMENQTLISLCPNCWSEITVIHEFAHQWFGDMITCGTWADVWLNEGFATYMEAIWKEKTNGYSYYRAHLIPKRNYYLYNNKGFPLYNPSWINYTPGIDSLYDEGIIYDKGACVLHLLRYTLGDTVFFNTLYSYATDTVNFKYKNATTQDLNNRVNLISGQNLDWFFNSWVYQANHPIYANNYSIGNTGGNNWRIDFLAKQTQANAGFFQIPIKLKISFTAGADTAIKVMNNLNNQLFSFNFTRQPTALVFDPDDDILIKFATTIGIKEISTVVPDKFELFQNYPNPFNPNTIIRFQIKDSRLVTLKIYDILGKEVATLINEKLKPGIYEATFYGGNLSSGIYFYQLKAENFIETKKLILLK
jgi:aminopeptidase N